MTLTKTCTYVRSTHIDEAVVELHPEEGGHDGRVSEDAGGHHASDYVLDILVSALSSVEPDLQRGSARHGEAEEEDGEGEQCVLHLGYEKERRFGYLLVGS